MSKIVRSSKLFLLVILAVVLCGCGTKSNNSTDTSEKVSTQELQTKQQSTESALAGNATVGNPWTESDEKGVFEATGHHIKAPEDATEVYYSYCGDEKMAQVTYLKDNIEWTYRIKASSEAEDISGMYYEWDVSEEGTVSGKKAIYMGYSDAAEGSEYIDDVQYVQVVNWYDDVTGVSYSLSASGDLNGMDIQVYAEQIYEPLQ